MNVLDIKNPKFLKKLNTKELIQLSQDIRTFIIESVSKTGGHLSSNLGIVDLTIAIHKTFDFPKDKIVFDVGHQSYTHKILTGRASSFNTLRQYKGLSGFQKMSESIYDNYEAGHSSTSLSAALGYAISRDLDRKKHHVIALIGDGSISNGLSYEALNHIGSLDTKLIIILNDNEMSISKNVGAMHNSLDKIRISTKYNHIKTDTKGVLTRIPLIGRKLKSGIKLVKESFKKMYMKEGYLFNELGLEYYGPINGHDYNELCTYLEMVKKVNKPVLLHVITTKGKGYLPAENDTIGLWHGVPPFDKETGQVTKSNDNRISWSEVMSNHLIELAKIDDHIIAITPAMSNGSKLNKFKEMFPKRFIDVGIAEEHGMILANTLALDNKRPFVSIYSTFLQRTYDEILEDIARMNSPVVIGVDRAGLVGEDGETHHGIYDIALLSHIPNIVIMAPSTSTEAGNMLYTAFKSNKPCAIRYSKNKITYQHSKYSKIEIGTWNIIESGDDAYLITYGDYVNEAIIIRNNLLTKNINIAIINARFIKPFDIMMYKEILSKQKPIFVYEEVINTGSLSSILITYASKNHIKSDITSFNIDDTFVKQGSVKQLQKELNLEPEQITDVIIKKLLTTIK